MISLEKKKIDLSENQQIWSRPGEDILMELDFKVDLSGRAFTFKFQEKDWAFSTHSYSDLEETYANQWITVTDTKIDVSIPKEDIMNWENKTIEFQIGCTDAEGDSWVCVDGTVTVAEAP